MQIFLHASILTYADLLLIIWIQANYIRWFMWIYLLLKSNELTSDAMNIWLRLSKINHRQLRLIMWMLYGLIYSKTRMWLLTLLVYQRNLLVLGCTIRVHIIRCKQLALVAFIIVSIFKTAPDVSSMTTSWLGTLPCKKLI